MDTDPQLPRPVTADKSNSPITTRLGNTLKRLIDRMASSTPSDENKTKTPPDDRDNHVDNNNTDNGDGPAMPSLSLDISRAAVVDKVHEHRCFRQPEVAQDIEVTDLPVFDSVTPYGVNGEVQSQLWSKEVTRLVVAVNGNEPPDFPSSADFAVDSRKAYELLATVSDIVFQALHVVIYDAECLLAEHSPSYCDHGTMERSRTSLYFLCNRDDDDDDEKSDYDPEVLRRHRADIFAFVDFCTAIFARILCGGTEKMSVAVGMVALLAKISTKLKVVSANLRDIAQTSIDNGTQYSQAEGLNDKRLRRGGLPPKPPAVGAGGDSSQTQQEEQQQQQRQDRFTSDPLTGRGGSTGLGSDPEQWNKFLRSKKDVLRQFYMGQCKLLRDGLLETFFHLVIRVRGNNKLISRSFTRYELCATVYETGFERFRTFVFQDQTGYFSGSGHSYNIRCASHAFHITNAIVMRIERKKTAEKTTEMDGGHSSNDMGSDNESIGTQITASYSREREEPKESESSQLTHLQQQQQQQQRHIPRIYLTLGSMNNVIAVLVPLLFTTPLLVHNVAIYLASTNTSVVQETEPVIVRPQYRVSAFFCLDTEEYREAQRQQREQQREHKARGTHRNSDPRSLSNSLIHRGGLLAGEKVAKIGRVGTFPFVTPGDNSGWLSFLGRGGAGGGDVRTSRAGPSGMAKGEGAVPAPVITNFDSSERIRKHRKQLDMAGDKMRAWVLEEKGVMVRCRLYVTTVMLVCTVLVVGGIAVGISVGDRIAGVDPFNITTYCWVLAAFVVLVAKSVRVHEWPWNDFLYDRVLCRSVSELSSVTSIHEQLILAYLLQTEKTSFLTTRGPFNAVFNRRSDDGFSIDRPLSMWAMLISGLLPVEVHSLYGRGLVCLDLRRGETFDAVPKSPELCVASLETNAKMRLVCERLQDQAVNPSTGTVRIRLERADMVRYKAVGFYGNDKAVFI
ncbi:uncharacterized protein B0H64DRAFT_106488 [Chaetomium fimeti]|uniref:Uncharacterized protein n=1 Tax=Chaetomium fimeti TaxID=1854472 RepID=A0AAE0HHH0_9PEZI|nr:hypothetical protein B0H64DRAFT_106488 [Chaetomium fimeti]